MGLNLMLVLESNNLSFLFLSRLFDPLIEKGPADGRRSPIKNKALHSVILAMWHEVEGLR